MLRKTLTCVLLLTTWPLLAQPLAERVPADAILYVGWRGGENPGGGYEQSHLKAILDQSNIRQLFTDLLPRGLARIAAEDHDAAEPVLLFQTLGGALWKHPSAFYFAGVNFNGP